MDDSLLVCGGEAFEAGLQVYAGARNFGKGMGIDAQIDELSRRFKQSKSRSSSSTPSWDGVGPVPLFPPLATH